MVNGFINRGIAGRKNVLFSRVGYCLVERGCQTGIQAIHGGQLSVRELSLQRGQFGVERETSNCLILVSFPASVIKCLDESKLKEKGFILAHSY